MANPFYLAAQGIELAFSAFKVGKSAKIGERLAGIGSKIKNFGVASAAEVGEKAVLKGVDVAGTTTGRVTGWWKATGRQGAKNVTGAASALTGDAGRWLRHDIMGQRVGVGAVSAGIGYYTSDNDATTGEKFGRALGFGIAGAYGASRFQDPTFGKHVGGIFRNLGESNKGQFWNRLGMAGKRAGAALGLPAKWGYKQSIAAGALYGLMSDRTSIAEGVVGGAALHFGATKMRGVWSDERVEALQAIRKTQGLTKAFKASPYFRTAAYGGMMLGAYNAMGQGGLGLNVVGGALKGGLTGAVLGGGTKALMKAPTATLALGLGGLTFAGSAAEGANTMIQSGAPGFDSMNADGDLALALHRLRHS